MGSNPTVTAYWGEAQMVEQLAVNQKDAGSFPVTPAMFRTIKILFCKHNYKIYASKLLPVDRRRTGRTICLYKKCCKCGHVIDLTKI